MRSIVTFFFSLCSLFAYGQPSLSNTSKIEIWDGNNSWLTTGSLLKSFALGNDMTAFTGPTTTLKTFTLPNASSTILTSNAAVTVAQGGSGTASTLSGILQGGSPFTAFTSSTIGQIPRCTGANTFAFGALDLEDGDAITGLLPYGNGGVSVTTGRTTGVSAAQASIATLTVGGTDATYEVSGNILITTAGSNAFSLSVDFTDENNVAQNCIIPLVRISTGATITGTISASGNVPFPSVPVHIRCKASTAITIKTSGTFTGCTYNVEGRIQRI